MRGFFLCPFPFPARKTFGKYYAQDHQAVGCVQPENARASCHDRPAQHRSIARQGAKIHMPSSTQLLFRAIMLTLLPNSLTVFKPESTSTEELSKELYG